MVMYRPSLPMAHFKDLLWREVMSCWTAVRSWWFANRLPDGIRLKLPCTPLTAHNHCYYGLAWLACIRDISFSPWQATASTTPSLGLLDIGADLILDVFFRLDVPSILTLRQVRTCWRYLDPLFLSKLSLRLVKSYTHFRDLRTCGPTLYEGLCDNIRPSPRDWSVR